MLDRKEMFSADQKHSRQSSYGQQKDTRDSRKNTGSYPTSQSPQKTVLQPEQAVNRFRTDTKQLERADTAEFGAQGATLQASTTSEFDPQP